MILAPELSTSPFSSELETSLLALVRDLAMETNQAEGKRVQISPDTKFQDELGFDSLTRSELLSRIEKELNCSVISAAAITAETPRQLLAFIEPRSSGPVPERKGSFSGIQVTDTEMNQKVLSVPSEAKTLLDVLKFHAARSATIPHLTLLGERGEEEAVLSYAELLQSAEQCAAGLLEHGLERGDTVSLMLPTSKEFFIAFFGVLLAGGVPVPLYPPFQNSKLQDHLERQVRILENAQARFFIAHALTKDAGRVLLLRLPQLRKVFEVTKLCSFTTRRSSVAVAGQDLALIQYTSGSTGDPKGVCLSHQNLLANIRAMGEAIAVTPRDVFISWLPLYHDMGLIGAWLGGLYFGVKTVIFSPLHFLARPKNWLWAIHLYRGTVSGAPNFAYDICARRIGDEDLAGLDLSCWRFAFNGAEAVFADTVQRFTTRFGQYRFSQGAFAPVYGLAENSVGLTFPPLGVGPRIDVVSKRILECEDRAQPVPGNESDAMSIVCCGQPLPRHEVRVVNSHSIEQPDRLVGQIQFRGPSQTSGYYRNEEATRNLFQNGWAETGDRGYVVNRELYLVGRSKDLIIRAGRNIYPVQLEQALNEVPGVRKGNVVVFGAAGQEGGTERLMVAVESKSLGEDDKARLQADVQSVVVANLGEPADQVLVLPPQSIPKTSSGKIRRSACRELYRQQRLGHKTSFYTQLASLMFRSLLPGAKRSLRMIWEYSFSCWCYFVFLVLAPLIWLGVMCSWNQKCARIVVRTMSRFCLFCCGVRLRVAQESALDLSPILVANHESYLDVIVLSAFLPTNFAFVAKGELGVNFLLRLPLQKIGAMFVDRFDAEQGVDDTQRLNQFIQRGESLVFFPEGTFYRSPDLLPFRMGAFLVAVETNSKITPLVIQGTRQALRPEQWFIRRSEISLVILPPVSPSIAPQISATEQEGREFKWTAAVKLRDTVRDKMKDTVRELMASLRQTRP